MKINELIPIPKFLYVYYHAQLWIIRKSEESIIEYLEFDG